MRPVAKRYMPLIQKIDEAGWEPVTRANGAGLAVERYGDTPGSMYFTVRLEGKTAGEQDTVMRIEAKALGIDPGATVIEEIAEKRDVLRAVERGSLALRFHIRPGETLVLAVKQGS